MALDKLLAITTDIAANRTEPILAAGNYSYTGKPYADSLDQPVTLAAGSLNQIGQAQIVFDPVTHGSDRCPSLSTIWMQTSIGSLPIGKSTRCFDRWDFYAEAGTQYIVELVSWQGRAGSSPLPLRRQCKHLTHRHRTFAHNIKCIRVGGGLERNPRYPLTLLPRGEESTAGPITVDIYFEDEAYSSS